MTAARYSLNRSLGGAIISIAVGALLSSIVLSNTLRSLDRATEARGEAYRLIRELDNFRLAMLNQETGLRGFLISGNETNLTPYREGRVAATRAMGELRTLLQPTAQEMMLLADAERAASDWQSNVGEAAIREMNTPDGRDSALRIESSLEGKQRFDEFREKLGSIETTAQLTLDMQVARVNQAEFNASLTLLLGTFFTLLICLGIGIAVNRMIIRPLVALAGVMGRISQRDLDGDIPARDYKNEVGAMARAVEVFRDGMRELDRTTLLRTTADTLPALVGYVDRARRIGFLNEEFARWFDLRVGDVSELQNQPLQRVFPGDIFPGSNRELEQAFSGSEKRFEHRLVRYGEGMRVVEAVYRPHRAPNGSVLGVVTLLTDITGRKQMEERLARQTRDLLRSNEELEQFAYVASHDLKAPLRGIDNLVSWIEEDLETHLSGDTRTNMDLLKSRVRRLESLLDDLLAYSRAGRRGDFRTDCVDSKTLVAEIASLIIPPEGFTITASPNLPTLTTAKAPLTQVLQNLISNAIKHHNHPSDGNIWVEAQSGSQFTEFTVTDDGPGIPSQFRERVFGMFQTLRPRDEVEGSGMGLAIVKKLVERVGGSIWITDGREGRGLSVHFTWPIDMKETSDGANR